MEEYELVSHVLRIIDQTAYRFAARRILGVHLAVGGCRVFDFDRQQGVVGRPDAETIFIPKSLGARNYESLV